jgi:hypothetical protein
MSELGKVNGDSGENLTGYAFGGKRAQLLAARLDYVRRHGSHFLFRNEPPPAPGWPRQSRVAMQEI